MSTRFDFFNGKLKTNSNTKKRKIFFHFRIHPVAFVFTLEDEKLQHEFIAIYHPNDYVEYMLIMMANGNWLWTR